MDKTLIAAHLLIVLVAGSPSAFAQGKDKGAAAQGTPFQSLQTQVAALEQQVDAMSQQIQMLQTQIGQVEHRLQSQITTINATLVNLQAQITDGVETAASLNARIAANEGAIGALTTAVTALRAQLTDAEALVTANTGNISALQSHVSSLQTLIAAHVSQITALQQQTAALGQFQVNLVNGSCAAGAAVHDVASGGFLVCTQAGGGTLQTLTRTVSATLFSGTNFLTVGCPTGGTTATVQVQYLPQTFYSGYFFQVQATCARVG